MSKSKVTYIGSTAGDEMCNLYLMFYSEAENQDFFTCGMNVAPQLGQILDQKLAQYDAEKLGKTEQNVQKSPKKIDLPIAQPYIGQISH